MGSVAANMQCPIRSGANAFCYKKAHMYERLGEECEKILKSTPSETNVS